MGKGKRLYEEKVIKYKGARHYLIRMEGEEHFKHHRWDNPAIVPMSRKSEFKKGYFLSGIEYDEEIYNEMRWICHNVAGGYIVLWYSLME